MSKPEPFTVPAIKSLAAFRPTDEDRKNLSLLLADRRETNMSKLLRDLVAEAAGDTRRRWMINAKRIAALEDRTK
ncbi:hypothetical protein [Streptomyces sp. NPDC010273]|uniref:hypothetical protein n=1 Tax=Streptomyces sp. NPDC010273 TaxID=3364829 RepID=UPI0036EE3DD4